VEVRAHYGDRTYDGGLRLGALQKDLVIIVLYLNLDQIVISHYFNEFFYSLQIVILLRHFRLLAQIKGALQDKGPGLLIKSNKYSHKGFFCKQFLYQSGA
jgi:hypothetical protein